MTCFLTVFCDFYAHHAIFSHSFSSTGHYFSMFLAVFRPDTLFLPTHFLLLGIIFVSFLQFLGPTRYFTHKNQPLRVCRCFAALVFILCTLGCNQMPASQSLGFLPRYKKEWISNQLPIHSCHPKLCQPPSRNHFAQSLRAISSRNHFMQSLRAISSLTSSLFSR